MWVCEKMNGSCEAIRFLGKIKLHGCIYKPCPQCGSELCKHWRGQCPKCALYQVESLQLHLKAIWEEGCGAQEKERNRTSCVSRVQTGIMAQKHCCRSCMAFFANENVTPNDTRKCDSCVSPQGRLLSHEDGWTCTRCYNERESH